ncbi:hypothetical protein TSMEX_009106 [Taenia solium]|eukprot:TsM_000278900 transcript=TsM_000278900 gene=TsM_000278900
MAGFVPLKPGRCTTMSLLHCPQECLPKSGMEVILAYTGGFAGGVSCYLLPAVIGARAVGGGAGSRQGQLAKKLVIYLLYFLGVLIFLSPVLTFLGVDA